MHSLGIARHGRKPWAEADFVAIGAGGIYVLEVKGGSVRRTGREWFSRGDRLKQSPIDQAAGAAAALFSDLARDHPKLRGTAVGHAVCFPDVAFDVAGAEIEPALVYDADDVAAGFDVYLDRVVAYWEGRLGEIKRSRPRPLSPADIATVIDWLAPDFDLVPTLRSEVAGTVRDLVRLTDEQIERFRAFEDNPRVEIRGSAGTGKTLLAAAEAERVAVTDSSVLFVCQSNALRDQLRIRLAEAPRVDVFGFHELCGDLITRGGIDDPSGPDARGKEYFDVLRPTLAMEALAALDLPPQWDVLIVDEAQDLLTGPASELLELLLEGGWEGGRWRLFRDPAQDLFAASHADVVDKIGASGFRVKLTVNCRNSAQIARDTAIATCTPLMETLPVQGPEPVWLTYRDDSERLKLVASQLRSWLDQGLDPSEITILSPLRRENSVLADGLPVGLPVSLVDGPIQGRQPDDRRIQFCTVAAFKGLESTAVLLLDAPHLGQVERAGNIYVGMTRARAVLCVLRDARFDETWSELQQDFGRRLVLG